jgi:argininosuccinate synthase
MVGDIGQGDDLDAVVRKAYNTGASKVVVEDLREEFLSGHVVCQLRARADERSRRINLRQLP